MHGFPSAHGYVVGAWTKDFRSRFGHARIAVLCVALLGLLNLPFLPLVARPVQMPRHQLALSTNPTATLGTEALNEPFDCYTDGAFGLTAIGTQVEGMPSVNALSCDESNFSGPDVDHLVPTGPMNGLTYNTHTDRSRIYDKLGWWPYNLWIDTSTNPNTWYSYMHTEDGSNCDNGSSTPDGTDLRTIGVWTSTDQGADWTYQGVAVDLDSSVTFNAPNYNCNSESLSNPPPNWIGGTGDQKFIVGQDGYLYLLYGQFTYDSHTPTITHGNLAIARSAASDKGAPGKWYKYYNGAWTQPGQGGHETYIMSTYNSGQVSNNQRTVAWNTYLSKYVMVFDQAGTGLYVSYSSDLLSWSTPELLYAESGTYLAYANLVGIGTGSNGTDTTIGRSAWLYYLKGNKDYQWYRRLVSWDNQTNLAANAPVATSTNFAATASKFTDTDISTCFCPGATSNSYTGNPGWVSVDLGSQKTFNEVKLYPYTAYGYGFPQDFSIAGSNTSSSGPWTTIASYSGYPQPAGATQVFSLGSQSYRYVELNVNSVSGSTATSNSFGLQLMEMEVYNDSQGGPPAPNVPVAAAASYQASTGFSSTQGQNQWFYEFEAPNETGTGDHKSPMTYDSANSRWLKSGSYSIITSNTQSPDSGKDSSRVWRAPAAGAIHITGTVKKADTSGGDGVNVKVKRNFTTIWPSSGGWQFIAYNNSTGYAVDVYTKVNAGDRIYFTVNMNGTNSYDTTSWDPRIDFSPVQSTYTASVGFSSTNQANQWAYQYFDGTNYTNMTWDSTSGCWVRSGTYTKICKNLQHPDTNSDSVRIWIAPAAGIASVTGQVKKGDVTGGDGTLVQIRKGPGTLEWGPNHLAYNDAIGFASEVSVPVVAGDMLLFVVDYDANNSYDTTIWDPTVTLSSWQPVNNLPFSVGAYVTPPKSPTDLNTAANWQNYAAANVDTAVDVNSSSKSASANAITNSKASNVGVYNADTVLNGYQSYTASDYTTLDSNLTPYKNDSNVFGVVLKDEPNGYNLEGTTNTYKHAKSTAPGLQYYDNLLPYWYDFCGSTGTTTCPANTWNSLHEQPGQLVLSNSGSAGYTSTVTSSNPLGQSFTVPTGTTYIDGIQLYLNATTWATNETLTLKLWDSPSKNTLLSSASISGYASPYSDDENYPYFKLSKSVTSGGTYYFELVHNGGGDNSVSGVQRSNADVYSGGAAYENGTLETYDFWFRLYSARANTPEINVNATGGSDNLTSSQTMGQTFTTPSSVNRRLYYIQPNITSWAGGQQLTLTLWDSPAKTHQIAVSNSLTASNNGSYPYFYVFAKVQPSTSYYWELTSNSSTATSVGESTSDVYSGGTAYKAGSALSTVDLYFNVHFGSEYENYLDDWVSLSGANFLQYDDYPFRWGAGNDESTFYLNMELVRERGLGNNVPYQAFLQLFSDGANYRVPSNNEMRYDVYSYLTYGFTGLSWFEYWQTTGNTGTAVDSSGNLQTSWSQMQELNAEMRMLGGTLKGLTSQAVYHTGTSIPSGTTAIPDGFFVAPTDSTQPLIVGYFTNASGRKYVMLTNRDYTNARTVTFQFNSNPSQITEISKTTGMETPVPGYTPATGAMTITFNQGEGRLFALPTGYAPVSNWALGAFGSATSSVEGNGWGVAKVNDDQRNSTTSVSMGWTSSSNLTVNHTESITLDMQQTNTISRVDLYPRNDSGNVGQGFPVNFTIRVATASGGPWTTVVTQTNYAMPGNSVQSFTFTSQSARYIMVQGTSLRQISTESGTPYRMQFAEFEAYT
jgi:hypothetical protein